MDDEEKMVDMVMRIGEQLSRDDDAIATVHFRSRFGGSGVLLTRFRLAVCLWLLIEPRIFDGGVGQTPPSLVDGQAFGVTG